MKPPAVLGIHHVTAVSGNPQRTLEFYRDVLGVQLVKLTVNFDDPGTYHLYFGDYAGQPGTIVTFFPWGGAPQGRIGTGQVAVMTFAIPAGSMEYWIARLSRHGADLAKPTRRFDQQVLTLQDRDGLQLELVEQAGTGLVHDSGRGPAEHAIRAIAGVALWEDGYERTARLLTETLGFGLTAEAGNRYRYGLPDGSTRTAVDLVCLPSGRHGRLGVGTVHHIAWRAADAAQQLSWREELVRLGYNVTPVMDRCYFKSIYFREPGGVLFEIATDGPGFTADEPLAHLGTRLQLPPWLEEARSSIERALPPLRLDAARED